MTSTVGVDVGGTYLKAVRLSPDGRIEERLRRKTPPTPDRILDEVVATVSVLGPGLPVGVGLAGLVDHRRGTLVWAPHLPGTHFEVGARLEDRLGVRIVVDNDANCAAVGEHRFGAARGFDEVLAVMLGTGIGLGLLVGGAIHRGRAHAGEAGHMTVVEDGEPCACGRRGCWETKVSGRRLAEAATAILGSNRGPADLFQAARDGHAEAKAAADEATYWLAVGVEALALVLDPDVIVVGGAVTGASEPLLEPVRRRLAGTEGSPHRAPIPVRAGILGPDAGAVGAAVRVAEETAS